MLAAENDDGLLVGQEQLGDGILPRLIRRFVEFKAIAFDRVCGTVQVGIVGRQYGLQLPGDQHRAGSAEL